MKGPAVSVSVSCRHVVYQDVVSRKKKQEKKYRKEYCHRSLFTVNAFKFKVQKQKEKEDTMNV